MPATGQKVCGVVVWWCGGVVVVLKPILVFSLAQAEQYSVDLNPLVKIRVCIPRQCHLM